jgi:hypothetical protein
MAKASGNKQKAKGRKEGNFPPSVRLTLAKRVNFRCSICDVQTAGPKTDSDRAFSIGKAAHIKAAAPGGPRYDENQSPADRRSIRNGIWCCPGCADIVDYDMDAYSDVELQRLKDKAERLARERVGRPPALRTPREIERAVSIYCNTEEARLEELDPRFNASVSWGKDGPMHVLTARERVDARVVVRVDDRETTVAALSDMFDYGGSRSFEGADIRLEGSPLFSDSDNPVKRLFISSPARKVTLTAEIGSAPEGADFVEFACEMTSGTKGLRIKGKALDGLIEVELTCEISTRMEHIRLQFDLQQWAGKPVLRAPHFPRLRKVVQALRQATPVRLHMAVDGAEVVLGTGTLDADGFAEYIKAFLQEMEFLRKVDMFFRLNITLPDDVHEVIRCAADGSELLALLDIHESEHQEVRGEFPPTAPLEGLLASGCDPQPGPIHLRQTLELQLLDKAYGPFEVEVVCARAVLVPVGPGNFKADARVPVVMRAVEGHRWVASYRPAA